ncbi:MAG: tetratricopeptide repeat protein [Candidatus Latescibacteria bacterium]|nr:tetratricopeptide repeat protein [Candidatus Latescibacterota bacterium]
MSKKTIPETSLKNPHVIVFPRIYSLLLIGVLGLIIYSNTFNSSFHFDDLSSITENIDIRDVHDVKTIWNYMDRRFVAYYSFAINYHFNRLDVFGYHIVNVTIHLLASFMVWWLTLLTLSTPVMRRESISSYKNLIALGCGLVFVSHPLQTQAVTYIVQRLASLATLFYLASLCLYLSARMTKQRRVAPLFFAGSVAAALLGIFTKEIVFTLPFSILLYEIYFFRTGEQRILAVFKNKKFWLYSIPFFMFLLILPALLSFDPSSVLVSVTSQRHLDPPLTNAIYTMTQFRVFVTYIRLLFLPIYQNIDYDFPASLSFFEVSTLAGFLFLITLLIIAVRLFSNYRLVSFGIVWFFLTSSVEAFKPLGNVIFEHRLYLPMFGFSVVLTGALYYILWKKNVRIVAAILLALVLCNSILTYRRNKVWKDDFTLWSDTSKKSPEKARPYSSLGFAYDRAGKYNEAIQSYRKALSINPDYSRAYYNLGNTLSRLGRVEEAIASYREAIRAKPNYPEAYCNLGNTQSSLGRFDEAIVQFQKALEIDPRHTKAYYNLGNVLSRMGRPEEAVNEYRNALRINPNYADAYYNMGNTYYRMNKVDDAISAYRSALQVNPNYSIVYNNLGNALFYQGKVEEAVKEYQKLLRFNPNDIEVYNNLGLAFSQLESYDRAEEYLKKAIKIKPSIRTHHILGIVFKEQDKFEEAVEQFLEVIRIDPDHADGHQKLSACYDAQGKIEEAKKHLDKAIRLKLKTLQKKDGQ